MDKLTEKALAFIRQHQMLEAGNTVIVACSGGADSVALLHFFKANAQVLGVSLRAIHINHAMRGAQSDADEAFVIALCKQLSIALTCTRLQLSQGASEGVARTARYGAFAAQAKKYAARLATAHTQSDNSETVLLHLARGAGVHGGAGIPPVRGVYVRPLLRVSRHEVEDYLRHHGLNYVTDATNATDAYARNRVRHHVMPWLEAVHPAAQQAIGRFAEQMTEVAAYLDHQAQQLLEKAQYKPLFSTVEEPVGYEAAVLLAAPSPVRKAALRSLILPWADPSAALLGLGETALEQGGCVELSKSRRLWVAQGVAQVQSAERPLQESLEEIPLSLGRIAFKTGVLLMVWSQSYEETIKFEKIGQKALNFYADCVKIDSSAVLRTRRQGDLFSPAGRGVTKPLKKWLSEARLSAAARASLPILALGSTVLWAAGFGFAEGLQPSAHTKNCIGITVQTEEIINGA